MLTFTILNSSPAAEAQSNLERVICEQARRIVDARRANWQEPPACFGGVMVLDEPERISINTVELRVRLKDGRVRNADGSGLTPDEFEQLVATLEKMAEMAQPPAPNTALYGSLTQRVAALAVNRAA